jgi:hypothetical protein
MQRIHYAGDTFLTGSAIAHSLLAYAQALAARASSATVTIPVWREDGSLASAEILIGPASQLIAEAYESSVPELEDDEVVARLNAAAASLRTPRAVPEETTDYSAVNISDLDVSAEELDQ